MKYNDKVKPWPLVFRYTISISIIIGIILFTIYSNIIYYYDIEYLNISSKMHMSSEKIKESYDYLINYILSFEETYFEIPHFESSNNGRIHFIDVRHIVQITIKLFVLFVISSFIGIYQCVKNKYVKIFKEVAIQLILIPIILSIPFMVNFEKSFEVFHKILFRNDYWIFDPKYDPVIEILPIEYFYHESIFLLLQLVITSSLFILIYYYLIKNKNLK